MNLILKQFKTQSGAVNFPAIFNIPSSDRITKMADIDFKRTNALIIGALTMAFESMNVKRGMNAIQILDLSEYIIDSASEDNLSFEDLVLFLQYMVTGKYELSYESMDIPKFMRCFEIYRQERHTAILDYRENRHLELKGIGDATRSNQSDALSEHFSRLGETISNLKNSLQDKKENETMKKAEKFFKDK